MIAEFPGANGIADLAVLVGDRGLPERIAAGIPFLATQHEATVAAAVPVGRTATTVVVARRIGLTERQVGAVLRRLSRTGAVVGDDRGFSRHPALAPIGRLYSLEAKVADWKRAMAQAARYAQWSDAAAVVLLNEPRELERAVARARGLSLGLAVGSRWIVRPRIRPARPGARLLASELYVQSIARETAGIGSPRALERRPSASGGQTAQRLSATA